MSVETLQLSPAVTASQPPIPSEGIADLYHSLSQYQVPTPLEYSQALTYAGLRDQMSVTAAPKRALDYRPEMGYDEDYAKVLTVAEPTQWLLSEEKQAAYKTVAATDGPLESGTYAYEDSDDYRNFTAGLSRTDQYRAAFLYRKHARRALTLSDALATAYQTKGAADSEQAFAATIAAQAAESPLRHKLRKTGLQFRNVRESVKQRLRGANENLRDVYYASAVSAEQKLQGAVRTSEHTATDHDRQRRYIIAGAVAGTAIAAAGAATIARNLGHDLPDFSANLSLRDVPSLQLPGRVEQGTSAPLLHQLGDVAVRHHDQLVAGQGSVIALADQARYQTTVIDRVQYPPVPVTDPRVGYQPRHAVTPRHAAFPRHAALARRALV